MIYKLLENIVTREEFRKFNEFTDIDPSEGHKINFEFTKPYIKNKKVLDIGCWSGQFEKLAVKEAKEIVGIDPDEGAIKFAKRTIKGATFLQGSAVDLPFKDKSFDVVTFMDVIEHVPKNSELKCIEEIYRVLKPDGILFLCTPYKHPISVLFDPAFWAFGHRHYSKKELKNMLSKNNFSVEEVFIKGGFWMISTFIISMAVKYILRIKLEFPSFVKQQLSNDYRKDGIVCIYIVAKK